MIGTGSKIEVTLATRDPVPSGKSRFRRWSLVLSVVVLLVLTGAWFAWSRIAAVRLKRVVDRIREDHDPLSASDVNHPLLPDARNAAIPLAKALSLLSEPPYNPSAPPYPPEWHRMAKAAIAANQRTLALVHEAAQLPDTDWRGSTPAFNVANELAILLVDGAVEAHCDGDDVLAIQRIVDLKREADIINSAPGSIGHAVALAFEELAIQYLEQVLPDMAVEPDIAVVGRATSDGRPVTQATLMKLIRELLDQRRVSDSLRRSAADELRSTYQRLQTLNDGATVLRPLVDLEAARVLTRQDAYWQAATKASFADAESFLNGVGLTARFQQLPPESESYRYSRVISDPSLWPRGYLIWTRWQVTIDRRSAAIAIGIRLYRASHGHWPSSLLDLVPEYLPAVPRNPMISGDKPIEYVILHGVLPGGHDRPMLRFAVGPRAAASEPIAEPCFGWASDAYRNEDVQWRDLSRWYPAPAATQPQSMPTSP